MSSVSTKECGKHQGVNRKDCNNDNNTGGNIIYV